MPGRIIPYALVLERTKYGDSGQTRLNQGLIQSQGLVM